MKLFNKFLLYTLTLLHTPFTLIRVVVASVLLIDLWCDKIINEYINGVEKEDEQKFCKCEIGWWKEDEGGDWYCTIHDKLSTFQNVSI
jgi:hypothetical protein|tara:strand:- start:955 stop:1218 length:264 start_codon:yes stop_codon:yes gene_type:complete